MGERSNVDAFAAAAGSTITSDRIKSIMIAGGGRTAYYLAKNLEQLGVAGKIIEQDHERCRFLAENLNNTLVLHGDGTDISLLKSEQVEQTDAFVALTGHDEENLLVALLAKQLGVKKVITKSAVPLSDTAETIGIDNVVIPSLLQPETSCG